MEMLWNVQPYYGAMKGSGYTVLVKTRNKKAVF